MIVKEKTVAAPQDKFGAAGHQAEMQMAFYLRRAFGDSPDIYVFNDLRLVRNGEVAQIDHLVFHRFGFVIVESKSVTGTIEVNQHLEFQRTFGNRRTGMKSPITQAQMQAQLLRQLLNDFREQLRRKLYFGTVQGEFGAERFKTLVAVSDQGLIKRVNCDPPELVKADQIASRVLSMIDAHAQASGGGGFVKFMFAKQSEGDQILKDRLVPYTVEESQAIGNFLLSQHTPLSRSSTPPALPPALPPSRAAALAVSDNTFGELEPPKTSRSTLIEPAENRVTTEQPSSPYFECRHCKSKELSIVYGQYGYYFKCSSCDGNTPIDSKCSACGQKAKISKSGTDFSKKCSNCETHEVFFSNPSSR